MDLTFDRSVALSIFTNALQEFKMMLLSGNCEMNFFLWESSFSLGLLQKDVLKTCWTENAFSEKTRFLRKRVFFKKLECKTTFSSFCSFSWTLRLQSSVCVKSETLVSGVKLKKIYQRDLTFDVSFVLSNLHSFQKFKV